MRVLSPLWFRNVCAPASPSGNATMSPRNERALTVGRPHRRLPGDDDGPLLVAEVVVIRPELLARRQVVQRAAEQLCAERPGHPAIGEAEAVALVLIAGLGVDEVDDHRASSIQPRIVRTSSRDQPAMTPIRFSSG